MKQGQTLFGHLATRFAQHPENLATEALLYLLDRSPIARAALRRFIAQADVTLPDSLLYRTQAAGDEGAIPDLVGLDDVGREVLLLEAKFWAGLTDRQPVEYLNRLASAVPGLLLFVAPARRFATLWPELVSRCKQAGVPIEAPKESGSGLLVVKVGNRKTLALASWSSLLGSLLVALESEGETAAASDARQLIGLCERMDNESFLPLRSEELASSHGRRVLDFCQLVDDVVDLAEQSGLVSTDKLRASGGHGWYARNIWLAGCGCLLKFSARDWASERETPLWLEVWGENFKPSPKVKQALIGLASETPPLLLQNERCLLIPFSIPTGTEREEVIQSLTMQLSRVEGLLRVLKFTRSTPNAE